MKAQFLDKLSFSHSKGFELKTEIQKIFVIGNAAGGKTRLSLRLSELYDLPLMHVDSVQFLPGMKIRPLDETRKVLNEITSQEKWIVDGFGPLDLIEKRFQMADQIVFIDFPLWRHYWWLSHRQFQSLWKKRPELPPGCHEATWEHTRKLIQTMWKMHKQMRPELHRILARPHLQDKVTLIQDLKTWEKVYQQGFKTDS